MPNKRSASKQSQDIPTIVRPRMSRAEKLMWKEYAKLLQTEATRHDLVAWAHKHKVKLLKSKNRVKFGRDYVAPETAAAEPISCKERCGYDGFTTEAMVERAFKLVITCNLVKCFQRESDHVWLCAYECVAVMRAIN